MNAAEQQVAVKAPEGTGSMGLPFEGRLFHITPDSKGLARVPRAVAEQLTRQHGWEVALPDPMPAEEFVELKARRDQTAAKRRKLRDRLRQFEQRRPTVAGALEKARQGLADGSGQMVAVQEARRALEEHDAGQAEVVGALQRVEGELEVSVAAIEREETVRETHRQREAAKPLLARLMAQEQAFIDAIIGLHGILVDRRAIATEIREGYPRVPAPPMLQLEQLAQKASEAWPGLHIVGMAAAPELLSWLRAVVRGPCSIAGNRVDLEQLDISS